jgi:hypothetical protein
MIYRNSLLKSVNLRYFKKILLQDLLWCSIIGVRLSYVKVSPSYFPKWLADINGCQINFKGYLELFAKYLCSLIRQGIFPNKPDEDELKICSSVAYLDIMRVGNFHILFSELAVSKIVELWIYFWVSNQMEIIKLCWLIRSISS